MLKNVVLSDMQKIIFKNFRNIVLMLNFNFVAAFTDQSMEFILDGTSEIFRQGKPQKKLFFKRGGGLRPGH